MSYKHLSHIKHRISLTGEQVALLQNRLVPISPNDYDLHSFAVLRELYGRLSQLTFYDEHPGFKKAGA